MAVPANCISEQKARELHDNWVATREPAIKQALGDFDTREFVFSVAELEEFLQYIKDESGGILNPGVRIYFAAYKGENNDKATVFLSPTKGPNKDSDDNYELKSLDFVGGGWPPKSY